MLNMPRPFVAQPKSLDHTLDSVIGRLWTKVNAEQALSREEKNRLAGLVQGSRSYGHTVVALNGWLFDFTGYLKRYWARIGVNGGIYEYHAPDKTSLRAAIDRVQKIVEII